MKWNSKFCDVERGDYQKHVWNPGKIFIKLKFLSEYGKSQKQTNKQKRKKTKSKKPHKHTPFEVFIQLLRKEYSEDV